MKIKFFINVITKIITQYKDFVDGLADSFTKENTVKMSEIESMKGKYTEEYIQTTKERELANLKAKYQKNMQTKKDGKAKQINNLCQSLKKNVDAYFAQPIKTDLLNLINLINASSMDLNPAEMELLNSSAESYFEKKAISNLFGRMSGQVKEGEAYYTGNGYYMHTVEMPDISKAYTYLRQFMQEAVDYIDNYTGEQMELSDNPISDKGTWVAKTKCHFLENNTGDNLLLALGDISDSTNSVLSEDDKRVIDALIDDKYPSLAKDKATEIAKASPELALLLVEDSRYSEAVIKAIEEV